MHAWPVQDAKARFSEFLDACLLEGPQMVTRRGTEAAVLVPVQEWLRLHDTNVVSELRKLRPHGGVVAWLQSLEDAQLHLSAVTLGEIQAGIELAREQ